MAAPTSKIPNLNEPLLAAGSPNLIAQRWWNWLQNPTFQSITIAGPISLAPPVSINGAPLSGTTALTVHGETGAVAIAALSVAPLPAFYSVTSGAIGLAMNSAGSDWGFVENVSANLWALAHANSLSSLGTAVLTWNATGNVAIPAASSGSSLSVSGALSNSVGAIAFTDGIGSGYIGIGTGHIPYIGNTASNPFEILINGTVISRYNNSGARIEGFGPTAGGLIDMTPDTGTWATTLSGPWASAQSISFLWERQGTQVTLWTDTNLNATATVPGQVMTSAANLPASITPSSSRTVACSGLLDNGTGGLAGTVEIDPTNSITLFLTQTLAGANPVNVTAFNTFTGAGPTGINAGLSVSYSL